MADKLTNYGSWGRYPDSLPSQVIVVDEQLEFPASSDTTLLPYGNGRSYGDVCLNHGGTLLVTRGSRRLLDADWERGLGLYLDKVGGPVVSENSIALRGNHLLHPAPSL